MYQRASNHAHGRYWIRVKVTGMEKIQQIDLFQWFAVLLTNIFKYKQRYDVLFG
jgi:hypothetical protein